MLYPLTPIAQIPIVPLPPAPIRPVGKQPDIHPLLASTPWIAAGAVLLTLTLLLIRMRLGSSGDSPSAAMSIFSSGPQVRPVRDPKYWRLILQAERESQQVYQQETQTPEQFTSADNPGKPLNKQ